MYSKNEVKFHSRKVISGRKLDDMAVFPFNKTIYINIRTEIDHVVVLNTIFLMIILLKDKNQCTKY